MEPTSTENDKSNTSNHKQTSNQSDTSIESLPTSKTTYKPGYNSERNETKRAKYLSGMF